MTNVVEPQAIGGVVVKELKSYPDPRGRFVETYRQEWFPGRPAMLQGNRSDNVGNVLRGLHYHKKQADYWYVTAGKIFVALADLRKESPTQGRVATLWLGEEDRAVYIPPGVAHGYYAPGTATMTYLVDNYYDGADEFGVAWDCPELAIPWPLEGKQPLLSDRDQSNPKASELDPAELL